MRIIHSTLTLLPLHKTLAKHFYMGPQNARKNVCGTGGVGKIRMKSQASGPENSRDFFGELLRVDYG